MIVRINILKNLFYSPERIIFVLTIILLFFAFSKIYKNYLLNTNGKSKTIEIIIFSVGTIFLIPILISIITFDETKYSTQSSELGSQKDWAVLGHMLIIFIGFIIIVILGLLSIIMIYCRWKYKKVVVQKKTKQSLEKQKYKNEFAKN